MILIQSKLAYAETIKEIEQVRNEISWFNADIGIILGIVMLGIITTFGAWLLDIASKPKHKLYMEITSALMAMLVVIGYFISVFTKIQSAAGLVK